MRATLKRVKFPKTKVTLSVIQISSRCLSVSTVLLPFSAFVFSVLWAFFEDFEGATLVFCRGTQVQNYLPSLSSAFGDFRVSKFVWIFCVTLHAPWRHLYAYEYYKYLRSIIYRRYHKWVRLACLLHVIENWGLIGLSYISSSSSLSLHAFNFTVFIVASELYMILLCFLLARCRNIPALSGGLELKSQKWRVRLLTVILVCSVILPYVYHRHNAYCEPGVYTIFAFLEYIVVLCNMAFHMTAYWDFYDVVWIIPVGKFLKKF